VNKVLSIQNHLNACLRYLLYDSVKRLRPVKRTMHAATRADTLRKCAEMLGKPSLKEYNGSLTRYAGILSALYEKWQMVLPDADDSAACAGSRASSACAGSRASSAILPRGMEYSEWYGNGGFHSRFMPVHQLRKLLQRTGTRFFKKAIVHGSIATLDDTPGFSDMDLAFIVRASVLTDASKLLALRSLAADILTLTLSFDPFMHHGPYFISEIDLACYPEDMFPTILFGYGMDLLNDKTEMKVRPFNAPEISRGMLKMFRELFQGWHDPFILKNGYELEWFLGSVLLLPAIYTQLATGKYHYKRDTFPLAEKDFTRRQWEPVRMAGQIRRELGARSSPPGSLLTLSRRLKRPGLISKWAARNRDGIRRAAVAQTRLGPDYGKKVLSLLDEMENKITGSIKRGSKVEGRRSKPEYSPGSRGLYPGTSGIIPYRPLTLDLQPWTLSVNPVYFKRVANGPYTDHPLPIPLQQYEKAAGFLVKHWSGLPVRPVSIFQIGSVGAPGISDLDFILVFDDKAFIDWNEYQPDRFPLWVRRVFTHPPYICPLSTWETLPFWYPVFHSKRLWGEALEMPVMPPACLRGASFGMLIEYLIVKIPVDLLAAAWEKPVRLRVLLCMLNSLKYTYMLAESSGLEVDTAYRDMQREVERLRSGWFRLGPRRFDTLKKLTMKACHLSGKLIEIVDEALGGEQRPAGRPRDNVSNGLFRFRFQWDFQEVLRLAYNNFKEKKDVCWFNPSSFEKVLSFYAGVSGAFNAYLAGRGCRTGLEWDGGQWKRGLREHILTAVAHAEKTINMGVPPQKYISLGLENDNSRILRRSNLLKRHTAGLIAGRTTLGVVVRRLIDKTVRFTI
jgi:hypothetical protein